MDESRLCSAGPDLPWPLLVAMSDLVAAIERLCAVIDGEACGNGRTGCVGALVEAGRTMQVSLGDIDLAPRADQPRLLREALLAADVVQDAALSLMPAELPLHIAASEVIGCASKLKRELESLLRATHVARPAVAEARE